MCVPFKGVFAGVSEPEVEVTVFSRLVWLVWLRSDSGEDEAEGDVHLSVSWCVGASVFLCVCVVPPVVFLPVGA